MTPPDSAPSAQPDPEICCHCGFHLGEHSASGQNCPVEPMPFGGITVWRATQFLSPYVEVPAAMLETVRGIIRDIISDRDARASVLQKARAALALLPPIRISGDASDTPAES